MKKIIALIAAIAFFATIGLAKQKSNLIDGLVSSRKSKWFLASTI